MEGVGGGFWIGRTFKESLQKGVRGVEVGAFGIGSDAKDLWGTERQPSDEDIRIKLARPNPDRVWYLRYALKSGMTIDEIYKITAIDRWFLDHLAEIVEMEDHLRSIGSLSALTPGTMRMAKRVGFSDRQLATMLSRDADEARSWRKSQGIVAVCKAVDNGAGGCET